MNGTTLDTIASIVFMILIGVVVGYGSTLLAATVDYAKDVAVAKCRVRLAELKVQKMAMERINELPSRVASRASR